MAANNKRSLSKISTAYIALGIALITIMTIIGTSAFLRVKDIVVEGASMYSADEVVEASGLSAGNNLLLIDSQSVSARILEELPFVSEVTVNRILPDSISIEITESIATAYLTFAGDVYIIDSTGRVLSRSPISGTALAEITQGLIEIRGAEIEETQVGRALRSVFGSEIKLQYMQDILEAAEREGHIDNISYINVSNIVNIYFGYMGRYRVILGGRESLRPSNLRHNFGRLSSMVEQIEIRYPNTSGDINMSDESGSPRFFPT